jgi:alkylation response protein AidB-like acyl-CoA dehydrogenase
MIDLTLSDDEKSLQESVRDVAAKEFPVDEGVRAAVDGRKPFDEARWSRIAGLGWFAIAVPEDKGGIGLGLTHEMLVFTELGRVAATGPLVGTSLAAFIAARAGNDELLEALTSGTKRAGIVVGDLVVDAGTGDLALRVTPDGTDIVELGEVTPVESIDDAIAVGRVGSSTSVLHVTDADIVRRLRVLVAAYLIGLAEATTDMSAEYAKIREQFGKPIGTFQAVKHRCAEMVSRAYVARAQLNMAAVLADRDVAGNGDLEVASALLLALDAGQRNSEDNIQNHGGIGVTAEHPAGVYVKRAQVYRHLAGRKSELNQIALNDPESGAA